MEAIIISGLPAAGKTTVASIISKRLGIRMIGGTEILKEMAKERGYNPEGDDWWDTPEGMKFLKERSENPNFDKETDRRLIKIAEEGNVVITSYTLPWLTKVGFKVWLSASTDSREHRMSARDNVSVEDAAGVIKMRDVKNIKLYDDLYGIRMGEDLTPFDLVLDVNKITAEEAAVLIIEKEREKAKAEDTNRA
jgi:cytidylate kinase